MPDPEPIRLAEPSTTPPKTGAGDMTDAELEARLGGFKPSGELAGMKAEKRAASILIDTFVAWDLTAETVVPGLALVLAEPLERSIRVTAQAGPDRLGLGVGWRVIPVIDLTVGLAVYRNFETDSNNVAVYGSVFKF